MRALINEAIQDIQSSLAVLPDIQVQIAKLTEAISTLVPPERKERLTPKIVINGVSDFPMSPTLSPMVETTGSVSEPINDLSNIKQLSERDASNIKVVGNESHNNSVESGDKSKKKMSVAERKKSRRARKKQVASQSQGESSSNEAEIEQKSAQEIQPKKIQEQGHALIREGATPTQPPPKAPARNKINRTIYRSGSKERIDRKHGNVYPRETLQDNYNLSVPTFEEMKLRPELLRGIRALGYDQPTSIQKRAIKAILTRRDVIIQVPRSEERTLTYLIGLLQHVDPRIKSCQGIVLVHSKDLCFAIQDLIEVMAKHRQISWSVCVGGYPVRQDVEKLKSDLLIRFIPHVIQLKEGRLIDLMTERRGFDISNVKMIVVEDSCIMFNSTFRTQALDIIHRSPNRAQRVFMTTATTFTLADIKRVLTPSANIILTDVHMSEGLELFYTLVEKEELKLNSLCELYKTSDMGKSIIFCDNGERVDWLADKLSTLFENIEVFPLHSMTNQSERHEIVKTFWQSSNPAIIVTTDSFAAVLSFKPVKYSIHFDLPYKKEDYHDRICCCGGYGSSGTVINILLRNQVYDLGLLERYFRIQSKELPEKTPI
ncbi:8390_t:CDS:2 [Cetraspora pellucida]|uniref:8390_t:CDS:1 n=1 Tax=Cetraspora pellucida TaxID=1433469 RepID=A0ACA9K6F5_9GLOM|nr:8390_t:CDS:2 [Cetraspora pellucida]